MRLLVVQVLILVCFIPAKAQVLYEGISSTKDTTIYLLGTSHDFPKEQFKFDSKIDSLIELSDVVFSELYVKTADVDYFKKLKELQKSIQYENGKSIEDFTTKDDLKFIYNFYRKNYSTSKRKFKSLRYNLPLAMHRKIAYDQKYCVKMDKILYRKALNAEKPIVLLDNVDLLKNAYRELNTIYDLDWLIGNLKNFEREKKEKQQLFNAYLSQDTFTSKRL